MLIPDNFFITAESKRKVFGRESLVVEVWWFKIVVGIREIPRVNKAHWVNPWQFFNHFGIK